MTFPCVLPIMPVYLPKVTSSLIHLKTKKVFIRDVDKKFVKCLGKDVEMNSFFN